MKMYIVIKSRRGFFVDVKGLEKFKDVKEMLEFTKFSKKLLPRDGWGTADYVQVFEKKEDGTIEFVREKIFNYQSNGCKK